MGSQPVNSNSSRHIDSQSDCVPSSAPQLPLMGMDTVVTPPATLESQQATPGTYTVHTPLPKIPPTRPPPEPDPLHPCPSPLFSLRPHILSPLSPSPFYNRPILPPSIFKTPHLSL